MTTPTGEEVQASIEALRRDARVWSELAAEVDAARQVARGLTLSAFEFSGLGHLAGLDSSYNDLQQRMVDLLQQGSANFDRVAGALRQAADAYERDEENAVHRLQNIY